MSPLDPAIEAAIKAAVKEAVGATVPYAHAGTVIGSLVGVILWAFLFHIPKKDKQIADAIDARIADKDKHLEVVMQMSPVLDRAIDALKGRRHED